MKSQTEERNKVYVIGIGCKFLNGEGPSDLWWHLMSGKNHRSLIPQDRTLRGFGVANGLYGNLLRNVEKFDNVLFEISDSEASAMDPQQRLVLEMTWQALESTNIKLETFRKAKTGVYLGMGPPEYGTMCLGEGKYQNSTPTGFNVSGTAMGITAGRISHFFGLHGPSLVVDTACASSLVAIHLGVTSLRNGEIDYAIVGGVNLLLSEHSTRLLQGLQVLSSDGICHTFDASANGYVRGEGCGIVILTKTRDVLRQKPFAEILGSAINHDGRASSLTSPNGASQEKVLWDALRDASISPEDVQMIEAHGTGTHVGDPIEMRALRAVYGGRKRRSPVVISSVKTSIGHAEYAAGVVGLIKVVLSLNFGMHPPHLHFKATNPHLVDLGDFPCIIPTQPMEWRRPQNRNKQRIGALSSFGFSGTNVHMIIGEVFQSYQTEKSGWVEQFHDTTRKKPLIFCISAATKRSVVKIAMKYKQMILGIQSREGIVHLADLCFSAATCRTLLPVRMVFATSTVEELLEKLPSVVIENSRGRPSKKGADFFPQGVVMLFSGQGGWYEKMGNHLYDRYSVYRESYDLCMHWIQTTNLFYGEQLNLFVVEYSLAQLWLSLGISPSVLIGHSIGECTATCIAGIYSLHDALKLVAKRAELIENLKMKESTNGGMVAVHISSSDLMELLEKEMSVDQLEQLDIAAVNGRQQVVVSGEQNAVILATKIFERETPKLRFQFLNVESAFHSFHMDPIIIELENFIKKETEVHKPQIPIISSVTGHPIGSTESELRALQNGIHWGRHLRSTVRFFQGAKRVLADYSIGAAIECGPNSVLCRLFSPLRVDPRIVLGPSLNSKEEGANSRQFEETIAKLIAHGIISEDIAAKLASEGRIIGLPNYQFCRKTHWAISPTKEASKSTRPGFFETNLVPLRNNFRHTPENSKIEALVFFCRSGSDIQSFLKHAKDQCVRVVPIMINASQVSNMEFKSIVCDRSEDFEHIFQKYTCPTDVILYFQDVAMKISGAKEHYQAELEEANFFLFAVQGLLKSAITANLTIVLLSNIDVEEYVTPQRGSFFGMVRSIQKEAPQLNCRILVVPRRWMELSICQKVFVEIFSQENSCHKYIHLHNGDWLVPQLNPVGNKSFRLMRDSVREDGVYIITGGLGGIGKVFCRWLVKKGAGHIVIFSRRPKVDEKSIDCLTRLANQGPTGIHIFSIDVGNEEEVKPLVQTIEKKLGHIRGVLHLAGTFSDGILMQQSKDKLKQVFQPKIEGAWSLHCALFYHQLDWFVLSSSIAVFTSFGGQINYAAANSYLDVFAKYRRENGLVGQSIQWGIWDEVGMSNTPGLKKMMKRKGALMNLGYSKEEGEDAFEMLLGTFPTVVAVTINYWKNEYFEDLDPLFSHIASSDTSARNVEKRAQKVQSFNATTDSIIQVGENTSVDSVERIVLQKIKHILSKEIDLRSDAIANDANFENLGIDSLLGIEVIGMIRTNFGIFLPSTTLIDYPTVQSLSKCICESLVSERGEDFES